MTSFAIPLRSARIPRFRLQGDRLSGRGIRCLERRLSRIASLALIGAALLLPMMAIAAPEHDRLASQAAAAHGARRRLLPRRGRGPRQLRLAVLGRSDLPARRGSDDAEPGLGAAARHARGRSRACCRLTPRPATASSSRAPSKRRVRSPRPSSNSGGWHAMIEFDPEQQTRLVLPAPPGRIEGDRAGAGREQALRCHDASTTTSRRARSSC